MSTPPSSLPSSSPSHPLVPLSAAELTRSRELLAASGHLAETMRFASVALAEPPKAELLAWREGDPVPRRTRSVLWDRADNRTYTAVVDISPDGPGAVDEWRHLPDEVPNFTVDEWHEAEEALKAHPRVQEALAARGITDLDLVLLDTWTYGREVMPEQWRDRRLGWADVWRRATPTGSPYAHPVSGLKFVLDMNTFELLEVHEDDDEARRAVGAVDASPVVVGEYEADLLTEVLPGFTPREPLARLDITQPDGPGFSVVDGLLTWDRWQVRLGFTPREGLVLHELTWVDGDQRRTVGHRMSFAEMVVPYRDPSFDHYRRTAYDIGEWGLGYMTTSLELGCDCLGEIRYLDAVLTDSRGEPYTVTNAICLHEEDDGVLWKHVDANGRAAVRRARVMVISFHATVANYEYLVYWRLHQDGAVSCEVRATGIMVTTPLPPGEATPATGVLVDERTYAPNHQHFIVARLDLDVDRDLSTPGALATNTVVEVDSVAEPIGPGNPYGLAVTTRTTPVRSESEAARSTNAATARAWKVTNPQRRNAHGAPVAYKLHTPSAIPSLFDPGAPQFERAPVIGNPVWVTRHHDDELWPAGDNPTQSAQDTGMSRWISDDEPLESTDVVLWHVFGIHHVPRPEDWPVMPCDPVGFSLTPSGFFDRNPTLDVAPPRPGGSGGHCHA
ncbi:MAG: primary-amine oxidase [Quadrisphaera sp.]